MFRLRYTYLVLMDALVEVPAYLRAWVEADEPNTDCEGGCVLKLIRSAVSEIDKYYPIKSCVSTRFCSTSWTLRDFLTVYWCWQRSIIRCNWSLPPVCKMPTVLG